MIPSENPLNDQIKKAKESGIEIPVEDLDILRGLKAKRAALLADEVIGDETRVEEMTTRFNLRGEK